MKCSVSQVLGLLLALFAGAVSAQGRAPDGIEWICVLDPPRLDTVRCEVWEPVPGYHVSSGDERSDARRVRADLSGHGAEANVTRMVREAPQRYAGDAWWIPLYTAPQNLAKVRELTNAVMCGNDRACRVVFAGRGLQTAALDAWR